MHHKVTKTTKQEFLQRVSKLCGLCDFVVKIRVNSRLTLLIAWRLEKAEVIEPVLEFDIYRSSSIAA
jgi:hypothetical protein